MTAGSGAKFEPATAPPKETPLFFQRQGVSLFGVLHRPAEVRGAFVFCHPFAEEKLWTHRVFVSFARLLAERGYAVLRFDLMGNGDSDGEFSSSSFGSAKEDLRAAIAYMRKVTGLARVSLLGLRLGATLASVVADEDVDAIQRLALWAPITNGAAYMQEMLRINVTTQMATFKEVRDDREALVAAMQQGKTVNVDGYDLSHQLYAEVTAIRLSQAPKLYSGACLIVHIDRQRRPAPDLQQLAATYGQGQLVFAQEEPFWKEIARSYQQPAANLFDQTLQWLDPR